MQIFIKSPNLSQSLSWLPRFTKPPPCEKSRNLPRTEWRAVKTWDPVRDLSFTPTMRSQQKVLGTAYSHHHSHISYVTTFTSPKHYALDESSNPVVSQSELSGDAGLVSKHPSSPWLAGLQADSIPLVTETSDGPGHFKVGQLYWRIIKINSRCLQAPAEHLVTFNLSSVGSGTGLQRKYIWGEMCHHQHQQKDVYCLEEKGRGTRESWW